MRPPIQNVFRWFIYLLMGYAAFGQLLDATGNSLALLSEPHLTYVGTGLAIFLWVTAECVPRFLGVRWSTSGQSHRIKGLGIAPRLGVLGAVVLLWIPRFAEFSKPSPPEPHTASSRSSERDQSILAPSASTATPSKRVQAPRVGKAHKASEVDLPYQAWLFRQESTSPTMENSSTGRVLLHSTLTPDEFEKEVYQMLVKSGTDLEDFQATHKEVASGVDGEYQIDICARFRALGVSFTVLVDCKHTSYLIDRSTVQLLAEKVRATGAHKGILFATSDFKEEAFTYAKVHGIALVKLIKGTYYVSLNREANLNWALRPQLDRNDRWVSETEEGHWMGRLRFEQACKSSHYWLDDEDATGLSKFIQSTSNVPSCETCRKEYSGEPYQFFLGPCDDGRLLHDTKENYSIQR